MSQELAIGATASFKQTESHVAPGVDENTQPLVVLGAELGTAELEGEVVSDGMADELGA